MDKRTQIWNVLHDGEITAIERNGETLIMFVSIPYLRRRMKPIGDSFVLTISGLTRLEYLDYDGKSSSLAEEIEVAMPEILSTDSDSMPITVNLTTGHLLLDFRRISFALDTGEAVEFEVIEKNTGLNGKQRQNKTLEVTFDHYEIIYQILSHFINIVRNVLF
ncbi:MAG: hypothetical protein K8S27_09735 [Candidatus Omnitrophica bacterium]|nr:hypothetical protein [Candidatus Omnitrophota bacterium]